ncbi:MAG: hypothetical protein KA100_03115 [Rickettsiales bacterium]|nr:hypothetical protein [Rickettsiales bacterium]
MPNGSSKKKDVRTLNPAQSASSLHTPGRVDLTPSRSAPIIKGTPARTPLPAIPEQKSAELEIKIELNKYAKAYEIEDEDRSISGTRANEVDSNSQFTTGKVSGFEALLQNFVRRSQIEVVEVIKEGVRVKYQYTSSAKRAQDVTLAEFLKKGFKESDAYGATIGDCVKRGKNQDLSQAELQKFAKLWREFLAEMSNANIVLTSQTKEVLQDSLQELFKFQINKAPDFPSIPIVGPDARSEIRTLVKKGSAATPKTGTRYDASERVRKFLDTPGESRSEGSNMALENLRIAIDQRERPTELAPVSKTRSGSAPISDEVGSKIDEFLFMCGVEEFTDKIPKLSEASQKEIVQKLSYLLEIDRIQIENKGRLNYAQKHPSLERFESKFFSEEDFKTKILTQKDPETGAISSTFLSADQFQIIKDFEEMLLEIANPPLASQRKRRKPLAMLDTGQGKTFIAELIKKYEAEIEAAKLRESDAAENLKQLAKNFKEIVQVNLANKHVLDVVEKDSSGKIYLIDEDFFIDDISQKLKSLVDAGAKVMRFGASQNPLLQKANEVRQELKKLAGSGEQDLKIAGSKRNRENILERRGAVKERLKDAAFTKAEGFDLTSWQTLPWKTGDKPQRSKITQYLIPGLSFEEAESAKLQAFADSSVVDVAVINFVKDDKHACLVCEKESGSFSFQKYWLQGNEVAEGEFKSLKDFTVFSAALAGKSEKKIATIYAGDPEFIVGGDYGAVSVLKKTLGTEGEEGFYLGDSQEIILTKKEQANADRLKQMRSRSRQTNPGLDAPTTVYATSAVARSTEELLEVSEKQTNEKDLKELSEKFKLKLRGDLKLGSDAEIPAFPTGPESQEYKNLISGRYFAKFEKEKFVISPIEGELDPKALALTRDLRNYLFLKEILNEDFSVNEGKLTKQIESHQEALVQLQGLGVQFEKDFRAEMVESLSGLLDNYKADPSLLLNVPNFLTLDGEEIKAVKQVEKNLASQSAAALAREKKAAEESENARLKRELLAQAAKNAELAASLKAAEARAKKAEDSVVAANKKVTSSEEEIAKINKELEAAKAAGKNVDELQAKLKTAEEAKAAAEKEKAEVEKKLEELKPGCGVLISEDTLREEIKRLKEDLQKSQQAAAQVKDDDSAASTLSTNRSQLEEELAEAQKKLAVQTQVAEDLKKQLKEIPSLQQKLSSAEKKAQALEKTLESASKERPISWVGLEDKAQFEAVKFVEKDKEKIKLCPSAQVKNPVAMALVNPTKAKQEERGQKFRYLTEVYENPKEVKEAIEAIFIKYSAAAGLSLEDAVDVVRKAKEAKFDGLGEYANSLKERDEKMYRNIRKFSAYFQKNAELCGIYSGEEQDKMRADKLVGLRAIFVSEDILAELSGPSKKMNGEEAEAKWQDKFDSAREKLEKNCSIQQG